MKAYLTENWWSGFNSYFSSLILTLPAMIKLLPHSICIYNQAIDQMFANGLGDWGSIPG